MSSQSDFYIKPMSTNTNSQDALVSVIIPTYDRPLYLREAIASAVQQKYRNIEIIVSDNCSPNNPQEIVESFEDPRICFFRNPSNLGMFTNTMNAFKKAKGKYVASLLDDDVWEADFLEKLVPPLEANPDLTLAFCDHYIIDSQGVVDCQATNKCTQFYKRNQLKEGIYQPFWEIGLIHRAVSSATAAVIRRNAVEWESIPSEVGGSWDIYLNYLCCRSARGAYYCPERLTRYREHDQTDTMLSGKRDAQAKARKASADLFCFERFMEDDRLQELKPYFEQQWVHANTTLGIGLMRTKQLKEARPYLWRALHQHFNLRTVAALMLSFTPPLVSHRF